MNDLQIVFDALKGKSLKIKRLFDYYDGNQPLQYTAQRLAKVFETTCARFTQNWCAVVIDSALDRLELTGWDSADKLQNQALDDLWNESQLGLEAMEIHEAALVTGEAFLIAEMDADGGLKAYANNPRYCVMIYDDGDPHKKRVAGKWFADGDRTRMVLYYPDRIEAYAANQKMDEISSANAFRYDEENSGNTEFGVMPVFHFRNSKRAPKSELANVIPLQDAVNKLFSDMMVTAEFSAFPARYVISSANIEKLKNSPNEVWHLPANDGDVESTQVGTLPAADLNNYSAQIAELANSIAVITRTPKHYFYGSATQPSGEALLAMEAPLTKKAGKLRAQYTPVWAEVGAYLVRLAGFGDVSSADITPVWLPVESIQPKTQAETRIANINSGLALATALRMEGRSADEIERIVKEKQDEQSRNQTLAQSALSHLLAQSAASESERPDERQ